MAEFNTKSINLEMEKKIKYLKKRCSELVNERNFYMCSSSKELFEKYVGMYNLKENALIIHHFIDNQSIYPYGDCQFDGDYACVSVRGSWDNWSKDYTLKKKCVREACGTYEGFVYYIIEENIVSGNEYEFKFKDINGDWIEPDDECSYINVKQDSNGIWNAAISVHTSD